MKTDLSLRSLSPPPLEVVPGGSVGRAGSRGSLPVPQELGKNPFREKIGPGEHPVEGSKALLVEANPKLVLDQRQVGLEFIRDEDTGRYVIRVYDRQSGDCLLYTSDAADEN